MRAFFTKAFETYRAYLIFSGFVLVGLFLVFLASSRSYPIALVNSEPLSASRFWKNFRAASLYYDNVVKTYHEDLAFEETPSPEALQADVLTQLVEAALIGQAVDEEVGDDLGYLVENKVGKYDADLEFQRATRAIYGMNFKDFREEVLIPQAKRDILAGRLFLKGGDIGTWLAEAKRTASVVIFSRQFAWDGGAVTARQ